MPWTAKLGLRMKTALKAKGYNPVEAAVECGVHPTTFYKYLRGKSDPPASVIMRACELADVPANYLLDRGVGAAPAAESVPAPVRRFGTWFIDLPRDLQNVFLATAYAVESQAKHPSLRELAQIARGRIEAGSTAETGSPNSLPSASTAHPRKKS